MGFLCNAEIGVDILPYDLHGTPKWHCTAPRMTSLKTCIWSHVLDVLDPSFNPVGAMTLPKDSQCRRTLCLDRLSPGTPGEKRCSWGMLRPTCQKHSKNRKVQAWLGMTTFWMAFDCYGRASGPLLKLYCSQECHQSPGSVQWRMSYIVSHCFTSHKGLRSRLHRFIVSSFHRFIVWCSAKSIKFPRPMSRVSALHLTLSPSGTDATFLSHSRSKGGKAFQIVEAVGKECCQSNQSHLIH